MNNDTKSFVLLKYEILTSNQNTWHLCKTYPESVKSKWAWRCAADVEHLAKGHKEAEECIRVAKLYRDGLATKEELNKAWNAATWHAAHATYATHAAYAATHATTHATRAAYAAYYATHAASSQRDGKWKLYISWLIEELCEYESKQ